MRERPSPPEANADLPPRTISPGASFEMRSQDLRPVVRDYARNLRRQLFELARAYGLKNPNDFSQEFAEGRVPLGDMDKVVDLVKKMTECFEKNRLPREAVREQEKQLDMARLLVWEAERDMRLLKERSDIVNVFETLAPAWIWLGDNRSFEKWNTAGYGSDESQRAVIGAMVRRGDSARALAYCTNDPFRRGKLYLVAGLAAVEVGDMETVSRVVNELETNHAQWTLVQSAIRVFVREGKFDEAERLVEAIDLNQHVRAQSWLLLAWHARLAKRPTDQYLDRARDEYHMSGETTVLRQLVASFAENGRVDDRKVSELIRWADADEKVRFRLIAAYRSGNIDEGNRLISELPSRTINEDYVEKIRAYYRAGMESSVQHVLNSLALSLLDTPTERKELFESLSIVMREEHAAERSTARLHRAVILFIRTQPLAVPERFGILTTLACQELSLGMPEAAETLAEFSKRYDEDADQIGQRNASVVSLHRAGADVSKLVEMRARMLRGSGDDLETYIRYDFAALQVRCGMDPSATLDAVMPDRVDLDPWWTIRAKADLAAAIAERAFGILKGNES